MYKFNMFPSYRHSVSGKGLKRLEEIFKYSKDLELDYNQRRAAVKYITPKLEKIEKEKGHFTIEQFEVILRDLPRWVMPRDQAEKLKIISRGGNVPKSKIEPKKEEKIKESKKPEESKKSEELYGHELTSVDTMTSKESDAELAGLEDIEKLPKESDDF